jgi:hypothetical protein
MKRLTAFISALLILTLGLPGVAISASNRTTVVGGVWALGAAAPGNNPIAGNTYANDALSESVINDGWPFSQVVNSANFNEFMRRISIILTLAEQWGVLPWSTSTSYTAGALVTGSDNYQYRALQSSAGKDPVSYPDYWALNTSTTPNYALSTGSNNAYAITIPQKNALTSGQPVFFKANFSNTGSATLSVNSQSPVVIKNARGVVLSSGDIPQNAIVMVTYDSAAANYVLISGNVAYLSELAGYALKNGSSSNKFSVANGVSGYDAVNYAQMMAAIAGVTGVDLSAYAKAADVSAALATKAPKGGDANTVFSVANGASGNNAVNIQQMNDAIAAVTGVDLSAYAKSADVSSAISAAETRAKTYTVGGIGQGWNIISGRSTSFGWNVGQVKSYPVMVAITVVSSKAGTFGFDAWSGGQNIGSVISNASAAGQKVAFTFIVPAGEDYGVTRAGADTASTIAVWAEIY